MTSPMLELRGVCNGSRPDGDHDISLSVSAGALHAMIGPNGAGRPLINTGGG